MCHKEHWNLSQSLEFDLQNSANKNVLCAQNKQNSKEMLLLSPLQMQKERLEPVRLSTQSQAKTSQNSNILEHLLQWKCNEI